VGNTNPKNAHIKSMKIHEEGYCRTLASGADAMDFQTVFSDREFALGS
jgi:hypothetical protein